MLFCKIFMLIPFFLRLFKFMWDFWAKFQSPSGHISKFFIILAFLGLFAFFFAESHAFVQICIGNLNYRNLQFLAVTFHLFQIFDVVLEFSFIFANFLGIFLIFLRLMALIIRFSGLLAIFPDCLSHFTVICKFSQFFNAYHSFSLQFAVFCFSWTFLIILLISVSPKFFCDILGSLCRHLIFCTIINS